METLKQNTLIQSMEKIFEISKESRFDLIKFKGVKKELKSVEKFFQVDSYEAILLSFFYVEGCLSLVNVVEITKHFELKNHEIIPYQKYIDNLQKRNIISFEKSRYKSRDRWIFNSKLFPYIYEMNNIPETYLKSEEEELNFYNFINKIDQLSNLKDDDELSFIDFQVGLTETFDEFIHLPTVKYIRENLDQADAFVFIDTIIDCVNTLENDFNTSLETTVKDYFNSNTGVFNYISRLLNNKTKLNQLGLIEIDKAEFSNKHKIKLSEKSVQMLKENEGIIFEYKENKSNKLIYPEAIEKRKLLYNPDELDQLEIIFKAMPTRSFQNLQSRLKSHQMTPGITALLYGGPGTGKTETVYQIAKKYNRPVFKVDIAATKSMWFGESQKLVKKIFTDYKEFKKREKSCPILLFNEADAVIGKRKAAGSSNVADTENAIQNILLEELENFDGILFATTNLLSNLDPAFERRFLFKVKFDQPSIENAAKIWKMKLPHLNLDNALQLAASFQFSGGQMENISKKCLFNEIVNGKKPSFSEIISYCENEKWGKNNESLKLGYTA